MAKVYISGRWSGYGPMSVRSLVWANGGRIVEHPLTTTNTSRSSYHLEFCIELPASAVIYKEVIGGAGSCNCECNCREHPRAINQLVIYHLRFSDEQRSCLVAWNPVPDSWSRLEGKIRYENPMIFAMGSLRVREMCEEHCDAVEQYSFQAEHHVWLARKQNG